MEVSKDHSFGTRAIHAGQSPDPSTGAIMTPIYQTSTYVQQSPGKIIGEYDYSRAANPTRAALETNLANLESAKHGLCFSSGVAATGAVLHLLSSGDMVLLGDDVYGGTNRLFNRVFNQMGIETMMVDMTDLDAVKKAIDERTKLIWLETPTNPTLKIADIGAVASIAKQHGVLLAVDNTFATPFLQTPLALGADIVCHSTTKYIGGHSDLVAGAAVGSDAALQPIMQLRNTIGTITDPHTSWMLLRSLATVALRMERAERNARAVCDFLRDHPKVERVGFLGHLDPASDQGRIFGGHCSGAGSTFSLLLKGGEAECFRMLDQLQLVKLAVSLGGTESLASHPASMTHLSVPEDRKRQLGIGDNLVRVSIGIEDPDDLIADFTQALAAV